MSEMSTNDEIVWPKSKDPRLAPPPPDPEPAEKVLEELTKEQLDVIIAGIKSDEPLKCAEVLKHYLADITACPATQVQVFEKKKTAYRATAPKVLGTEGWALDGRYKWCV